jgi:pheromone shutdown protein TraB
MATRLLDLSEEGNTVAVVGIDHLESLAERLDSAGEKP